MCLASFVPGWRPREIEKILPHWSSPAGRVGTMPRTKRSPSAAASARGTSGIPALPGLARFLGGALVVAYPSFGEGFGLPVLEAMACGAPILTTHRLSLPEVGGDAVLYAEPDVESLTAGLNVLFDDEQRRRDLGAAAHVRSREFTWEASADAHLAIWARAVALE